MCEKCTWQSRKYKQGASRNKVEAQATGALLWKMIAGAMGLVRKSGGQIWTRTRFCLIGGANLGLRPLIFDFCRRVSMCRRLKDHGRDRLAFSVSGWRQVSAHQNERTVAA